MKVLYDHQIFCYQTYGGVSRYYTEVARELRDRGYAQCQFSLFLSTNHYLDAYGLVAKNRVWERLAFRGKERISSVLNQMGTVRTLSRERFDVFHPTFFDPYFIPRLRGCPFVVTVYDMIHEMYPYLYPDGHVVSENKREFVAKANRVIAISNCTRGDVLRFYPDVDPAKVVTVYLGNSIVSLESDEHAFESGPPYLLFVGSRGKYKNFNLVLEAFPSLVREFQDLRLICVGGGPFTDEEARRVAALGLEAKVERIDASDDRLGWLYRHAQALVYPSSYEGFGLPILEAFAAQCPVVTTNAPAIVEVGGDAVLCVDTQTSEGLGEGIRRVLSDSSSRDSLVSRGRKRALDFTWERTARETLNVYTSILQ